jgi:small subunit ribosomal protein S6
MARLYDLMLLIDPNVPDGRQDEVMREVQSMIESGGTIVGSYDWGERRMAYEIDHRPDAHYHLFQFESENELLERLQHQLKIMDGVLRFRIIRLKPGAPTPPPPRESMPRERREEREPEGRVAARAAADAPPDEEPAAPEETPAAPEEAPAAPQEPPAAPEEAPAPPEAEAEPAVAPEPAEPE